MFKILSALSIAVLFLGCSNTTPTQQSTSPASNPSSPQPQTEVTPSIAPTQSSQAAPTHSSQQVTLADGRVSFVLPPGFTPMTAEEIALKYPRRGGNTPQYAYANERRNVSIAITFSNSSVAPAQVPELKTVLKQSIQQSMPDSQWLTDEMTAINGNNWAHLEFISRAIDTQIHNDAYFTSFDGKMLGFNFNATVAQWDALSAELRKTRDSIVLKP